MSYFIACVAALLKELSTAESAEYFCHICLIGNIPRKDLHFCLFQVCVCVAFENKKKSWTEILSLSTAFLFLTFFNLSCKILALEHSWL